jgi:site-specific recombinase XerD
MAVELHKIKVQTKLTPRREPYWGPPLADDLTLGFRKIDAARGTWIARKRKDTKPGRGEGRYAYRALGAASDKNDFEAARQASLKWREATDAGVTDDAVTVADACREYVEHLRREKGDVSARDAEMRFNRTVYGKPFGSISVAKLRTPRFKEWRDGLELSKGSSNRTLTALKAALNLAVTNRRVMPGVAREWGDVKPYKDATNRRTLFLDLRQRRRLLENARGAVRDLIEAVALTGARAGELTKASRSQFDQRLKNMTFRGKTGSRAVPLSDAALVVFKRAAKGKLPSAPLFTRDDGKAWAHSDWDELVRAAAEAAKLPKGTCLYTLRHSFVTQAITDGMTTLDVARLCGTSVGMIEKHYGHLVADAARKRLAAVTML